MSIFPSTVGIRFSFTKRAARKNYEERKSLYLETAVQVACTISIAMAVYLIFFPGVDPLSAVFVSAELGLIAYGIAVFPILVTDIILKFFDHHFSLKSELLSTSNFCLDSFLPIFFAIPLPPPRVFLAA